MSPSSQWCERTCWTDWDSSCRSRVCSSHQISRTLLLSKTSPWLPFHTCPCSSLDVPSRPQVLNFILLCCGITSLHISQTGTGLWLHRSSPPADTSSSGEFTFLAAILTFSWHRTTPTWSTPYRLSHVQGPLGRKAKHPGKPFWKSKSINVHWHNSKLTLVTS